MIHRLTPRRGILLLIALTALALSACSDSGSDDHDHDLNDDHGHGHETADSAATSAEKGEHNGRLLRADHFTLELAIFETGVPPEYRAWAYADGKLLPPAEVQLRVQLTRLDRVDTINFTAHGDTLRGDKVIAEPHSFSVAVTATYKGAQHRWEYDSFEGRTRIEPAVADALGITTDIAGPARLRETINVYGTTLADPARERAIRARFAGVVSAVHVQPGDRVSAGQALLTVESNESLKIYTMTAPIAGSISALSARTGQQTGDDVLLRIVDTRRVAADLAIFPAQLARVKPGAPVTVMAGTQTLTSRIEWIAPEANANQSVNARVMLDPAPDQPLPLGAMISARVDVAEYDVPLAVKRSGLQAFRDFTVVYARIGADYEVRMLELGREAGEWVEVLGGLEAGTRYVTGNSFVIKADIEKSGASHDH